MATAISIEPTAFYDDDLLYAALELSAATLARARRDGRLHTPARAVALSISGNGYSTGLPPMPPRPARKGRWPMGAADTPAVRLATIPTPDPASARSVEAPPVNNATAVEPLMTAREAAASLAISERMLWGLTQRGEVARGQDRPRRAVLYARLTGLYRPHEGLVP